MSRSLVKKAIMPIIAISLLLVMVAWLAGSFDDKVSPNVNYPEITATPENIYLVKATKELQLEPVAANVAAKQATIISSRILARIEKINVRSGQMVTKGQPLITLEQSDLLAQLSQAQEKINALQARFQEAEKNNHRTSALFKQKLVSVFDRDKSLADFQAISAELTSAEQGLKQAETTLTYATLSSPINGKVVDRFAEPGSTAQPGNKLLSLYNPLSLRVEANVREALALTLKQGQSIAVELPALNKQINAEIEEIVPAANTGSRSFLIKASIEFEPNLLPGMYARILIPADNNTWLYVPKNKVSNVGQLNYVWLFSGNQVVRQYVRLGKTSGDKVAVISGLKEGDTLVDHNNALFQAEE